MTMQVMLGLVGSGGYQVRLCDLCKMQKQATIHERMVEIALVDGVLAGREVPS